MPAGKLKKFQPKEYSASILRCRWDELKAAVCQWEDHSVVLYTGPDKF